MRGRAWKRAFDAALTAIATVAVMTACASSGDQHGTQAAPTQPAANQASTTTASAPQEFVSKRYDFGVTVPQGWSAFDAEVNWSGKGLAGPGSIFFTDASDPGMSRTLMAAAATVPTGMQLADWRAAVVEGAPPVCAESPSGETTTLGGEPALASTARCSDGYDVNELVALHGGRGYVIYMPSAAANDDAEDQRIFEAIRQSFHFTN